MVIFKQIIRGFKSQKFNNFIKVISLTLGLFVGILLFAHNVFERSYDDFQKDGERIYRLGLKWSSAKKDSDVSGTSYYPVAHAMEADIPEIEKGSVVMYTEKESYQMGENVFKRSTIYADTSFFDLFSLPIIYGNPSEALKLKDRIFLSQKFAQTLFGNVDPIGKVIASNGDGWVVAGIFKDIPENTHLPFEAVKSIENKKDKLYMGWGGGDAFYSYIKVSKNADMEQVYEKACNLFTQNLGEGWKENADIHFQPLSDIYLNYSGITTILLLLGGLGFSILFVSAMNYILISLSSLSLKAKQVSIQKVNGASRSSIFKLFLAETGILMVISLLLSGILFLLLENTIRNYMGVSLSSLFNLNNLWVIIPVCLILFLLAGAGPAYVFSSVSVMQAFRQVSINKKMWKKVLLGAQFGTATFLFIVIIVLMNQYDLLINKDLGYNTDNLYFVEIQNTETSNEATRVKNEIRHLPFVESSTVISELLIGFIPGNSIVVNQDEGRLFTSRVLEVDEDFFNVMQIPLLKGMNAEQAFKISNASIVNEEFVQKLNQEDPFNVHFFADSEETQIAGIVKDFHVGLLFYNAQLPIRMEKIDESYLGFPFYLLIKLNSATSENIKILNQAISDLLPTQQPFVMNYNDQIRTNYSLVYTVKNVVSIIGLLALIITILGLIGFMGDEIARRTKEIAVRKVNGADGKRILNLLWKDVIIIIFIIMPFSLVSAYMVSERLLEEFAVRVPTIWFFLAEGLLITISIIFITVTLRSYKALNTNPVEALKSE